MIIDFFTTLRQIAEVQEKRRKNWNGGNEPQDAKLEEKHQQQLEELRKKLP